MIASLDKSELILLSFTQEEYAQLKWKHSKEFEWQGSMYDIVDSAHKGSTIQYWCWWDYEETELNKALRNSLAQVLGNNPKNQQHQFEICQFYKSLFFESQSIDATHFISLNSRVKNYINVRVQSQFLSPETPPPELG